MATEVRQLIDEGAARLRRVADDPRLEAELLLAAALGRDRAWLHGHAEERVLDCDATDRFESHLTRRALGEPVAYILGEKEFWSLALAVTPDVLVPRPETELIVERVLARVPAGSRASVLDLATGSGAIALAIAHERPACTVLGTDRSEAAVALAVANARRLGLANASFRTGSWYAPVAGAAFRCDRLQPTVRRRCRPGAGLAGASPRAAAGAVRRTHRSRSARSRDRRSGSPPRARRLADPRARHDAGPGGACAASAPRDTRTVATHVDLAGHDRCTEARIAVPAGFSPPGK